MKKFTAEVEANEELKAKLRACKTQEEIAAVVRENNFELSLDDLDAAAGGNVEQIRITIAGEIRARATLAIASGITNNLNFSANHRVG